MISYSEAKLIILETVKTLGTKSILLKDALNYVLAEHIKAPFDLPLFDNSSVDGYGVKIADVSQAAKNKPVNLPLQDIIRAGNHNNIYLNSGCTVKILTGAKVPKSVDAIVMREYCDEKQSVISIAYSPKYGENIRRQSEELKKGKSILESGTLITPAVIGLLATLGINKISVYKKPKIAIVTTGDELLKPGRGIAPGKIYDSNSFALLSAINLLGIVDCMHYHAKENKSHTHKILAAAAKYADVIISAGGVSVGDYDFVKDVSEELGFETLIWKIAIKPGKPVYFGRKQLNNKGKIFFGLPGNPVSSLITYHQLVKPALQKIIGLKEEDIREQSKIFTAKLTKAIAKKPGRMEFVRGRLMVEKGELKVSPTIGQESHMLSGLSNANCLIHFPLDKEKLNVHDLVDIELIQWANN
jgi:molybdopterin molybdotransferase